MPIASQRPIRARQATPLPPARDRTRPAAHPHPHLSSPLTNNSSSFRPRYPGAHRPRRCLPIGRSGGKGIGIHSVRNGACSLADVARRAGSAAGDSVRDRLDGVCQRRGDADLAAQRQRDSRRRRRRCRTPTSGHQSHTHQDPAQLWPYLAHGQATLITIIIIIIIIIDHPERDRRREHVARRCAPP